MHTLCRCCALLAFLAAPACAAAGDQPAAKYAVLVGINRYEHDNLRTLGYAEADVEALGRVLKTSGYRVTLLTGAARDPSLRPTKENIEKHLERVLKECKRKDTVLLAFAGHGLQFEGGSDAYFCPADARPFKDRADTLVSLGGVYRQLQQSFAGVKVLLVDACRDDPDTARGAGGAGAARGITADNAPRPPRGVAALFSCSAGQQSYENDQLKHGVFFYHVLQGLRGDAARDGEVTFVGLTAYVSRRVAKAARQSPNLKADLSDDPVLVTAARAVVAPPAPPQVSEILAGMWRGKSAYPPATKRSPFDYDMVLVQEGNVVVGFIKEPNTFGKRKNEPWLHSLIKGRFNSESRKLTYTKTYDGTAGEKHDVEYFGYLSGNERRVSGSWKIQDEDRKGSSFKLEKAANTGSGPCAGVWSGEHYPPKGGKKALKFLLILTRDGQALSGLSREPNTLSKRPEPYLHARFKGRVIEKEARMSFTKTYDGTAGVKRAVTYNGSLSGDGTTVEGTWAYGGSTGRFTLRKLRLDEPTLDSLK